MKKFVSILLTISMVILMVSAFSMFSFAETAESTATQASQAADSGTAKGLGLLAAAIVTGLAGIGGGLAIASGAPAAIAANAENPKTFGKSIIFVALGESIVLFGFVISILVLQKV